MYQIVFYTDENGRSEVYEYIEKLRNKKDNKDAKIKINKITAYINQLSKKGLALGEPYIKRIDNNIWELRPLRDRILFAYCGNNRFMLLNVFMKATNKTPSREKEKAKRLLEDYKKRSLENEWERVNMGRGKTEIKFYTRRTGRDTARRRFDRGYDKGKKEKWTYTKRIK